MTRIEWITGQCLRRFHDHWRVGVCVLLSLALSPVLADELTIKVHGLKDPLLGQVSTRLETFNVTGSTRLTPKRLQQRVKSTEQEARKALKPFGYYHPEIHSNLSPQGENTWRLDLEVRLGPPVIITNASIEITGDGAALKELRRWKKRWPLGAGKVLDQTVWESQKQAALDLAEAAGYLSAGFTRHIISANLDSNQATTELVLETGPQAVVGTVTYNQDAVRPEVLELLPRFKEGQAYDAWLVEKFRLDIWRTGYFKNIEVIEERRLEEVPPRVNFVVTAETRNLNTYQGSIGYGTDTGVRTQVLWTRHLLSTRGDSLDVGLGWQQRDNEYSFRSNYRLPRRVTGREFWIADLFVRRENEDFEVKPNDDSPDIVELTNGSVVDYSVKLGRLKVRDLERGYQQIFETWYGQYVLEKSTFSLNDFFAGVPLPLPLEDDLDQFREVDSSISLGVNWDWPVVRGSAFATTGHHERAWIFTANELWGSDLEFTQAYFSSNWTKLLGRNFKLLLRGEVGYSDAHIENLVIEANQQPLRLSVTDLPNLYRFKAGGSRSVRGYGFESLSNNGIGSNNVIAASAELEWQFRQDWSAATFVDVGNAFNDWGDTNLKTGAGVGIRWYSIAGPIRLDFAQALSYEGHPWTVHFTIGTPLL